MKTYTVKISLPCANNNWQAEIKQRRVEAKDLNELIDKAFSAEEHRRGARIIEVWEPLNDKYLTMQRIV